MTAPSTVAKSPSWTEVVLGALLSVILGAVLGAAYLILEPVPTLKAPPKPGELKADTVYFLPGSRNAGQARDLATKQRAFFSGKSVALTESELNTATAGAGAAAKSGPKPAEGSVTVKPGAPNFRIDGGELQIAVPLDVNVLGFERNILAQVRGSFERRGGVFTLVPAQFYLGACPLHRLPVVGDFVYHRMLAAAPIPAEAAIAWGNLSDVAVDGATLRLTMP